MVMKIPEIAKQRFEVVRSPDGRITNYYDKSTGRTLSQAEFDKYINEQLNQPEWSRSLDYNSTGAMMERLNQSIPFAEQLGFGPLGVLPLDQQKPKVLAGTVVGGEPGTALATVPKTELATVPKTGLATVPKTGLAETIVHDAVPMEEMSASTGNQLPAPTVNQLPAPKVRGNPNPIGPQGPIIPPNSSSIPRSTMPTIPTPPPAGSPFAAVRSWFGKLSPNQKAGLGIAAGAVGITPVIMNRAAETARKQQAQPAAAGAPSAGNQPSLPQGPNSFDELLDPITGKPVMSFKQQPSAPAPFKARAAATMRAATGGKAQGASQAASQPAPADMTTGQPSGTDKVPVTTTGKPDYNYYAEMMNAADRNDAYARDLINLKEQARMAAIDAAARGEKFRFVPVKDYMNNRIIFVNAGGNDVVLDMNDPRQGVEYQKLLDKAGVDSATMTDWMHRSSRPMLRYMQPTGGNRDVTPDFGYARRSVEMGEGNAAASPNNFKLPDIAHVTEGMPKVSKFGESRGMDLEPEAEMPMPTATPPSTRPAPQPTSVAAIDKTMPMATMEPNPRRGMELDWSRNPKVTPSLTVADRLGQLGTSVGDINEAYRRSGYYDYDTDTLKPVSDMSPKANEFESAIEQAKSQKQAISNLGKKRR